MFGEAVVNATVQLVLDRLISPEVLNFICEMKLDDKLVRRFETTLYAVHSVLNDAEQKQIKDAAVKKWLDDLKDAVYEADDVLDELSTKAATRSPTEVNLFFSYLNFQDRDLVNKIGNIIDKLEYIAKHKDILGLKNLTGEKMPQRPKSTSLEEVSKVYGRDGDKMAIIDLLLSEDPSDSEIGVIPIVGMSGVGKTTLAQFVCNDKNLRKRFDLFAWVCVTREFHVPRITKSILEGITSEVCDQEDLNLLQLKLVEKLRGNKFLIVLDDAWNENYTDWDPLTALFHHGSKGSKIIVTTQSERVASVLGTVSTYHLGHLSDDDCWLVFKHACPAKDATLTSYLQKNRGDILSKCKGLPLAAKILGGLLRSKPDVKSWDIILKDDIWNLSDTVNKIIPALQISYHYLPSHLKRCFVHSSLLPRDCEFAKNDLILLWMAEGLLQPMNRNMTLEGVGYEYFDDLTSRSFYQSLTHRDGHFLMHGLIHDLATFFAGDFYRTSIDEGINISKRTRHVSFNMLSGATHLKISHMEALGKAKGLRTFLSGHASFENAPHILQQLLNCKCLRVLSLIGCKTIGRLHDSIAALIHLRYLDLSGSNIRNLPDSICNLHNLQTLKLVKCLKLKKICTNIENLVNMRYLDVRQCYLPKMPTGMSNLKSLHFLNFFVVSRSGRVRIGELKDLLNLRCLSIKNLQYISDGEEASQARMRDKKNIEELKLYWGTDCLEDSQTEIDILQELQPHESLKILSIEGYRGTSFPNWLGYDCYQNMTTMTLHNCKHCCSLPPLGQLPSLKRLVVKKFDFLVSIDAEFYRSKTTPFPSLEYLEFSFMPAWQGWALSQIHAFPQLRQMKLYDCPRLVGDLPTNLPALEKLEIKKCHQLASNIPRAGLIWNSEKAYNEAEVLQAHEGESSLKNLEIFSSIKVDFPMQQPYKFLESLSIKNSCDSLVSFPIDNFPNLGRLLIWQCENLKCLSVSQSILRNLQSITIQICPNFVSLPTLHAPNMTHLKIRYGRNLKSLPGDMANLLPKLQRLDLRGCPRIEWNGVMNMPPNLIRLQIDHCVFAKCNMEWHLPSLTSLTINGRSDCSAKSFPQEVLLPSSLSSLRFHWFEDMEILDCDKLVHLTYLQTLQISSCPKLEKMIGELPPSLTQLSMWKCPLLEERYTTKNAEVWPKICHIPNVYVDDVDFEKCTASTSS